MVDTQLEPAEIKQLLAKGEIERDRLDVERVSEFHDRRLRHSAH